MTSIASFALECAAKGRWARGLLALQSSLASSSPAAASAELHDARIAVAAAAAPHHWESALALLDPPTAEAAAAAVRPSGPLTPAQWRAVGAALRAVSENETVGEPAYAAAAARVLERLGRGSAIRKGDTTGDGADSRERLLEEVFLQATRWVSYETALFLHSHLSSASSPTSSPAVRYRLSQLRRAARSTALPGLRLQSVSAGDRSADAELEETTHADDLPFRPPSPASRGSLSALSERESADVAAALSSAPTAAATATLLRLAARQQAVATVSADTSSSSFSSSASPRVTVVAPPVPWRAALAVMATRGCTAELAVPYARCVGLRAPAALWREALRKLAHTHVPPVASPSPASASSSATSVSGLPGSVSALQLLLLAVWLVARGGGPLAAADFTSAICGAGGASSAARAANGTTAGDPTDPEMRRWRHYYQRRLTQSERESFRAAAVDLVRRTPRVRVGLLPAPIRPRVSERPWLTLPPPQPASPRVRCLAAALAAGYTVHDVQLSALSRDWAAEAAAGSAEAAARLLALYQRLPTPEFQRRAVQAAIERNSRRESTDNKGSSNNSQTSQRESSGAGGQAPPQHRRRQRGGRDPSASEPHTSNNDSALRAAQAVLSAAPQTPLGTHSLALLMQAAGGWAEALAVLRAGVRRGSRCNPQLLSALMNHRPPPAALLPVLRSYPAAVNKGIGERAAAEFGLRSL